MRCRARSYFSDLSYPFDDFLRSHLDETSGGVPAGIVAGSPRIVSMTPSLSAAQREKLRAAQANKVVSTAEASLQRQMLARLFIAPNMEQDDKQLCCARLNRLAEAAGADASTACGWAAQLWALGRSRR